MLPLAGRQRCPSSDPTRAYHAPPHRRRDGNDAPAGEIRREIRREIHREGAHNSSGARIDGANATITADSATDGANAVTLNIATYDANVTDA